jgi:hypothetical protein
MLSITTRNINTEFLGLKSPCNCNRAFRFLVVPTATFAVVEYVFGAIEDESRSMLATVWCVVMDGTSSVVVGWQRPSEDVIT